MKKQKKFTLLYFLKIVMFLMMISVVFTFFVGIFNEMPEILNAGTGATRWHLLYEFLIVAGLTVVFVNCFFISGVRDELLSMKSRKYFVVIGYTFLAELIVELLYSTFFCDTAGRGLFEIFNFNISVEMLLYLIGAVVFLSLAEYIGAVDEYKKDSDLTI